MLILSMKRIVILKDGNKKVKVETVSTIKQVNAIVERFRKKDYTIKVYSV
jgi:hypothetical protein